MLIEYNSHGEHVYLNNYIFSWISKPQIIYRHSKIVNLNSITTNTITLKVKSSRDKVVAASYTTLKYDELEQ